MSAIDDIEQVEARTGHTLSRTHLLSVEGGKQSAQDNWFGYPLFWQARGDGSGEHIVYGKYDGQFYLARKLFDPKIRKPVPFSKKNPGRSHD